MRPYWLPVDCRSGYQPPKSLLPSREKVPSICEADESRGRNGKSPSAGRPVSGPYERAGDLCIRRRGGTLGRPPYPAAQLELRHNKGAFKKGSARFSTTARPAAAKDEGKAVS